MINITMMYIYDIFNKKICNISRNQDFARLCIDKSLEFLGDFNTNDLKPDEFKSLFKNTMYRFILLLQEFL